MFEVGCNVAQKNYRISLYERLTEYCYFKCWIQTVTRSCLQYTHPTEKVKRYSFCLSSTYLCVCIICIRVYRRDLCVCLKLKNKYSLRCF